MKMSMIKSVTFENFRALSSYTLELSKFDVLIGPNNSGKSTILDGFRLLSGSLRYAADKKPKSIHFDPTP